MLLTRQHLNAKNTILFIKPESTVIKWQIQIGNGYSDVYDYTDNNYKEKIESCIKKRE